MPPLGIVGAVLLGLVAFGGLFATLTKFAFGWESVAVIAVLGLVVVMIGVALRNMIAWFGVLVLAFFGGWLLYTFAYLA